MRTGEPAWWESVVALKREGKGKEVGGEGKGWSRAAGKRVWTPGTQVSSAQPVNLPPSARLGGSGPIPAFPWNLGCILSFTAIRPIRSGTTLMFASSPRRAGFPVLLPSRRGTALGSPPNLPLLRSLPILPFSGLGGGVVPPLLFL